MLKCLHNSFFLLLRTSWHHTFSRADIIVLTLLHTYLILNLSNIKISYIEAVFLFNSLLDVTICRLLIRFKFSLI